MTWQCTNYGSIHCGEHPPQVYPPCGAPADNFIKIWMRKSEFYRQGLAVVLAQMAPVRFRPAVHKQRIWR